MAVDNCSLVRLVAQSLGAGHMPLKLLLIEPHSKYNNVSVAPRESVGFDIVWAPL
jgi:hypothetical protein